MLCLEIALSTWKAYFAQSRVIFFVRHICAVYFVIIGSVILITTVL